MPASFTGSSISFQTSASQTGTYQAIQVNGNDLSVTASAGKYIALSPADFAGVQFLKLVSSSAEAAGRTLTLSVRTV